MVNRSPSLELVGKAIEAHLSPTVLLQSLPRALELLAHVCLLADKLQQEITRILRDDERKGPKSEYARLSEKSGMRLKTYAAEVEKASRRLWQISVDLRLNHIAAVLSPGKKVSVKILYLIECYFPAPTVKDGPSSSKKTYTSSKLFIRAMPDHITHEYEEASRVSREWYTAATESSTVSEEHAEILQSKRQNGAVLAKHALAYTSRVTDYIRKAERTLAGNTGPTAAKTEIKQEIKPETRYPRSPSPIRQSKASLLVTTETRLSSNTSVTPSNPRRVQAALGSERTTSMVETEAMLFVPKDEAPSSDRGDITQPRNRVESTTDTIPAVAPTKPKKRPRPSFPPREGPDYTRPLPHVPSKKLRTFEVGDLKR